MSLQNQETSSASTPPGEAGAQPPSTPSLPVRCLAPPAVTGQALLKPSIPSVPVRCLEWGMRLILGGTFLASGFLKVQDPGLFAMDVRNFELIGDPWVAMVALALPWVELVTGLGVTARLRRIYLGSLALLGASLLVFILALGVSWARGLEISCGCFGGGAEVTNYPLAILRNLVLLGLSGALWGREFRNPAG